MAKLIKASIDVTKIKKEHLFKGEKGTYANVDIWIEDEPDQYGNHAGVKQSYKVGDSFESHYIGNGKKGFGWDDAVNDTKSDAVKDDTRKEAAPEDDSPF